MTVDPDLVAAGNLAVGAGMADSLSGWVNDALVAKALRDRQVHALAAAVADYETQFGEITAEEVAARQRADAEAAVVVRGRHSTRPGPPKPPAKGVA